MRTTIDIDSDLLAAAKEIAKRERNSVGAVASELLRRGLGAREPTPAESVGRETYGFRPFPKRGGIVTNEQIDRLRNLLVI